jgi:AcrR family transcriptional regulator
MTSSKGARARSSETRAELIEAAEQLLAEERCAAVTARRMAEQVGLKRQIVHYYFGTIDDLMVAVMRSMGEKVRARLVESLESGDPLRAVWGLAGNPTATAAIRELSALAIRRPAIQVEMKRNIEELRQLQAQALSRHFEQQGSRLSVPPLAMLVLVASISSTLAFESVVDVSLGHADAEAVFRELLRAFAEEGDLPARHGPR